MTSPLIPAAADLYGDLLDNPPAGPVRLRSYRLGLTITTLASLAAANLSEHYGASLMRGAFDRTGL